jgi:tetratricopeptide (TPR) repeat protein
MKPMFHNYDERISRYTSNNMTREERYAFEEEMLENEALADAVEGAALLNHAPTSLKRIRFKSTLRFLWLLGLIVVLALTAYLLQDKTEAVGGSVQTVASSLDVERSIVLEEQSNDSVLSFAVLPEENIENIHERWRSHEFVEPMEPRDPSQLHAATERKIKRAFGHDAIYHINHYKVVDYRQSRQSFADDLVQGLPADNKAAVIPDRPRVTYVDFLKETMGFFAAGDYMQATEGFEAILRFFPDDVNAQFYGGLSAYYQGDYREAVELLSQSRSNLHLTFYEEAEYYRAVSLVRYQKEDGCEALQKIASMDGFYAERAKEEVSKRCQ